MELDTKRLDKEEKRFYGSIVRTVGKDTIGDIARYGCGGGFPGITYYDDILYFIRRNKKFIQNWIQSDIQDGVLIRSNYYLFRKKLNNLETLEIDNFIFLGKLPKVGNCITWIGWYSIESFLFRLVD